MSRRQDWPRELQVFCRERRSMPFAWGQNDCALLAADWVWRCTGHDPIAHLRGAWHDAVSAARQIDALGGLYNAVTEILGPPISPSFARRGDVALIEIEGRETLSVCVGEHALGPAADGALLAPMTAATAVWIV